MLVMCLAAVCSAEHRVFTKERPKETGLVALLTGSKDRIDAHIFQESACGLCVVDEGDGKPLYGSLEKAMQQNGCAAGVNGGYFSANAARTPIGLVRHGGSTLAPLGTSGFTVVGVVYDTGSAIRLERTARLKTPLSAMREGIQGGPFLVERGSVVPGLEKTRKAARTFIATDGKGRWCVAVTSALTLHELASWLAQKDCMGNFQVHTALNLDGGSSSAFWDKEAGVYRSGFKAVRNYVGVRPRDKARAAGSAGSKRPAR